MRMAKYKELIEELLKMPPMVIATAYLYAINYTLYGEDVTEKWLTATQQAAVLGKAYRQGYHDAMERVNQVSKASEFGSVLERNIDNIRQAGLEGKEFRFRIDGRLFAVRELPQ